MQILTKLRNIWNQQKGVEQHKINPKFYFSVSLIIKAPFGELKRFCDYQKEMTNKTSIEEDFHVFWSIFVLSQRMSSECLVIRKPRFGHSES